MRWTLLIAILAIPCLLASAEDADKPEVKLPYNVEKAIERYESEKADAEQEYLETIMKEQERLRKALEREVDRFRLDDKQKDVVKKILSSEDEAVRKALYSIASEDVKVAVAIQSKLDELTKNAVVTDMLGNPIKPEQEKIHTPNIAGKWEMTYTMGDKVTHTRTVEIDKDLNMTLIRGTFGGGTDVLTYNEKTNSYVGSGKTAEDTYNFETLTGTRTNGTVTHNIKIKKIK